MCQGLMMTSIRHVVPHFGEQPEVGVIAWQENLQNGDYSK
jgi:hypothetical protein